MTLIFLTGVSYTPIIFQGNILSILSRELGGKNSQTQSGEPERSVRERISDIASEKTQTLSAKFVSSGCRTALSDKKELAAETKRTQKLLGERKRVALS